MAYSSECSSVSNGLIKEVVWLSSVSNGLIKEAVWLTVLSVVV